MGPVVILSVWGHHWHPSCLGSEPLVSHPHFHIPYSHCFSILYFQEAHLAAKYTEVNAINRQRLQNLEFAQNLLRQVSLTCFP